MWNAWVQFSRGKLKQRAVSEFWFFAERESEILYRDLVVGTYIHGGYNHFVVQDTKRRDVFVATVRDRIVHQLVSNKLARLYSPRFYTYSCAAQKNKGVRLARACVFDWVRTMGDPGKIWFAKLDVRHYFSSVDQNILLRLLKRRVVDQKLFVLCEKIILSFGIDGCGLPLGNLTSQWFANIYLHELDWFVKHELKIKKYMRYNDDMIVLVSSQAEVQEYVHRICDFAFVKLYLEIPPAKISIGPLSKSLDVLGICTNGERLWVRNATIKRAKTKLETSMNILDEKLLDSHCSLNQICENSVDLQSILEFGKLPLL